MQRILFIDRDGTLVEEPYDFQVDSLDKIRLCPDVISSLLALKNAGYRLIMISNQDGLGTSSFPQEKFQICHDFILHLFSSQGIDFDDIFICPHQDIDQCECRKPKIGLLKNFLQSNNFNREYSWMIGDRATDKQFADNLNINFLPVSKEHGWQDITAAILNTKRQAVIKRKTNETDISIEVILDSNESSNVETPIGFFSHMLEQIAKHAGFTLNLQARGDTEVDEHHLVEDTAIALGEALKTALGDKWGIGRYGFTLPMDEALASVAIDLSGRRFFQFEGKFTREFVGGLATEMIPHFFNSLADSLSASLHISVKGENHHHMIEACFKGFGRALRQAIQQTDTTLPSTKGVL
ncbi:histidinol-phosphatase [Legionella busanensis]|uniref:Histidine biosynthesis bifunctional protein HisB n=1 Tax=Legionella busanensis TaxID=190655 RepID=A0A378JNI2_9GAMM|nr:bifunctional histidinol-phosphatase/imidazoleglycerol-phosphate dehydratase HisB [Legionella busanensis]STX51853.1 histidinol-phosphatase [Legionella busanensis]